MISLRKSTIWSDFQQLLKAMILSMIFLKKSTIWDDFQQLPEALSKINDFINDFP